MHLYFFFVVTLAFRYDGNHAQWTYFSGARDEELDNMNTRSHMARHAKATYSPRGEP